MDVTPHDLRRTFAENLYSETRDLRQVQAGLGHRTLGTTAYYLQRSNTQLTAETLQKAKAR